MINFKCSKCNEEMEAPSCLAGQTEECPKCGQANKVPIYETTESGRLIRYLHCGHCQNITPHQVEPKKQSDAEFVAKLISGILTAFLVIVAIGALWDTTFPLWALVICALIVFSILKGVFSALLAKNVPWQCQICNQKFVSVPATTQSPDLKKGRVLAVVSVVLGLLSLVCPSLITAIPAVICGHIAFFRMKSAGGGIRARWLPLLGTILGYVGILCALHSLITPFSYPISREYAKRIIREQDNVQISSSKKISTDITRKSEKPPANRFPSLEIYSAPEGSGGSYKDPINGYFEVEPPAGFRIRERRDKSKFTITSGSSHLGEVVPSSFIQFISPKKVYIAVTARKTFTNIERDFESVLNGLPKRLSGIRIHRSRFLTIDGVKGGEILASWQTQQMLMVKYKKHGLDHAITINCDVADFPKFQDQFLAFLRSYRSLRSE